MRDWRGRAKGIDQATIHRPSRIKRLERSGDLAFNAILSLINCGCVMGRQLEEVTKNGELDCCLKPEMGGLQTNHPTRTAADLQTVAHSGERGRIVDAAKVITGAGVHIYPRRTAGKVAGLTALAVN